MHGYRFWGLILSFLFLLFVDVIIFYSLSSWEEKIDFLEDQLSVLDQSCCSVPSENSNSGLFQSQIYAQGQDIQALGEKLTEVEFFMRNNRQYSLEEGRFLLNFCNSVYTEERLGFVDYDFLLRHGDQLFDFDSTAYIRFSSKDTVESFHVQAVNEEAENPIYKVTIDTEYRLVEGIVYPSKTEDSYRYDRLFEVRNDFEDYTVYLTENDKGYLVSVDRGVSLEAGKFQLNTEGEGYSLEILKSIGE